MYESQQSLVASASSSSEDEGTSDEDESTPTQNTEQPIPDDLIGSVLAVTFDVFSDVRSPLFQDTGLY